MMDAGEMEEFNGFCRGGYGVLSRNYGMIQYGNSTVRYGLFCQIALAGLGKRRPMYSTPQLRKVELCMLCQCYGLRANNWQV